MSRSESKSEELTKLVSLEDSLDKWRVSLEQRSATVKGADLCSLDEPRSPLVCGSDACLALVGATEED